MGGKKSGVNTTKWKKARAWLLVTKLYATRKITCFLLRAGPSLHFPKSQTHLDRGNQGRPQQSEGMSRRDYQDTSAWTHFQHLFYYQYGCNYVWISSCRNKIPIHPLRGLNRYREVNVLHASVCLRYITKGQRMKLKQYTFRIAQRICLFSNGC